MSDTTTALLIAVGKLLVAWAVFSVLIWAVIRAVGAINIRLQLRVRSVGRGSRMQGLFLLLGRQITALIQGLIRLTGLLLVLAVFSSLLTYSFSLFEATQGISSSLLEYITVAATRLLDAFVGYLPNLGVVIVVVFVTHYAIKLLRVLFQGIEEGILEIRGFHTEWAKPTVDLLAILIVVFALVVVFPYLPGGESPAFRGISIFIGVLLSLGSGSAMGNIISGVILTYMRAYKNGDRVKIGETLGDVTEKNLLVTRVRTIKNVEIIVPNATVLANHIVNYSSEAESGGLILHTTVTIGYDAPWRRVHELLIEAALATPGVLAEPRPFVLQTALDDYYVSYEINAHTREPHRMAQIYSDLHSHIQDSFNRGGVEIMSPAYNNLRDGNYTTIPEENRPAGYRPPTFRVTQQKPDAVGPSEV